MNRRASINWRNWRWLMWCIMLPLAGAVRGAEPGERAWNAANKSYSEGAWQRAESEYAEYVQNYPQSDHYGEAILRQATARFSLAGAHGIKPDGVTPWSYKDVVTLLDAQKSRADDLGDKFAYLTAEAYSAISNFPAAADAYGGLAKDFPGSSYRTEALYKEAYAHAQMGEPARVIELLQSATGGFQQVVKAMPMDDWVARGLILLTKVDLEKKDYEAAAAAVAEMPAQKPGSELEWKRQYYMCRVGADSGRSEEALRNSTNLLAAAGANPGFKADSYLLLGDIYRQLEQFTNAIAAYEANLGGDLPVAQQRQALFNIVKLNVRQDDTAEAMRRLDDFLKKHPDDKGPGSDLNLLALGELQLKQHYQAAGDTNFLRQAETNFQRIVVEQPDSDFWGEAQLNLGWCLWVEGKIADAGNAFSNAVQHLPHDEDQAVALFKLGDALYAQTNYAGAMGNYGRIIDEYAGMASVTNNLFRPALYQMLRAGIAQNDFAAASRAMGRISDWYPDEAGPAMLLVGEAENQGGQAPEARRTYTDIITRWPGSALQPVAELGMAGTYERENDWTNAVRQLSAWVVTYTNHPKLPEAEYRLYLDQFKAGDPLAFQGFTNFVAKYPSNAFTPDAQNWIGNYYLQQGDTINAEVAFKKVLVTNAAPELRDNARLRAGMAAFARPDYVSASEQFEKMARDSNCPPDLRLQAEFAYGDAAFMSASQTNQAPCRNDAINNFRDIATNHPTDPMAPLAWGRMGDCYKRLGDWGDTNAYSLATNAYSVAALSPNANVKTRSEGEYGIGQVLEKMAQSRPAASDERKKLLEEAVNRYYNVVNGRNLRRDEQSDPYYVQLAGLSAARIETEEFRDWTRVVKLYQELGNQLPALRDELKRRIENANRMSDESSLPGGGP